MMVLVGYDVSTIAADGQKRLRKVAKCCLNFGQRVQNSVFECSVTPADWVIMKDRLVSIIDPEEDSLRFYYLGKNWEQRIEHIGTKATVNIEKDTLIC